LQALTPVYLFALSVLVVIALVLRGFNVALAISLSFTLYSIPLLGLNVVNVLVDSMNYTLLNTVSSLVLAMFLANIYQETKASRELVDSLEHIGSGFASITVPAVIGLLPMPAGAYISATMINPIYTKIGFNSYEKTFLNYWFRHIWSSVWPLYQNIILASAILGLSYSELAARNWPIIFSSIASGLIVYYVITRGKSKWRNKTSGLRGLIHLWPFILLAVLTLVFNIPLYLALIIVTALTIILYKASKETLIKSLKHALDPSLIILITVSLMYGKSIDETGLAKTLADILKTRELLAVILIPFSITLATGFEFTFVALGFPVLREIMLTHPDYATLGFLGGYIGTMLSPAHACLVLSAKYFQAELPRVYKYILPASILAFTVTTLLVLT
jgi:integral membrane protein (TIGR00529 family)